MDRLDKLKTIFSQDKILFDSDSLQHYGKDWTNVYQADPLAIVFPESTEQVKALVDLANLDNIALVPSGGRTGLSGGAVAGNKEVVVSFERMNKLREFHPLDRSVICEAGVITQTLQQFAIDNNLIYPVDFASSGSSQIGGNIATNAGGIKVIRYGLTRNWVLGLKVVTGKGDILELNNGLQKNATGYDLRHLMIASEGTLGFITEATMQLAETPKKLSVVVLGVTDINTIMNVFEAFKETITLTAFECFSELALQHVLQAQNLTRPFEQQAPFYILLEFENENDSREDQMLSTFEMCSDKGWIIDAVMSQSEQQSIDLWRLREDISESISNLIPYKNDLSVTVSNIARFLDQLDQMVSTLYADFEVIWYGHIGDGNLHLNILKPKDMEVKAFFEICENINYDIFSLIKKMKGSISAEHGVGMIKRDYLNYSRSEQEIAYMKALKNVFDPNGIMNPGKIFNS
ncbi:MAG: FAD-binding oxidoreductase [Cocleimonas sp.]